MSVDRSTSAVAIGFLSERNAPVPCRCVYCVVRVRDRTEESIHSCRADIGRGNRIAKRKKRACTVSVCVLCCTGARRRKAFIHVELYIMFCLCWCVIYTESPVLPRRGHFICCAAAGKTAPTCAQRRFPHSRGERSVDEIVSHSVTFYDIILGVQRRRALEPT